MPVTYGAGEGWVTPASGAQRTLARGRADADRTSRIAVSNPRLPAVRNRSNRNETNASLDSRPPQHRGLRHFWILVALLGASASCRSPEEYRRSADEETYAILDERRAQLFSDTSTFSIAENPDSLRQRLLRDEVDEGPLSLAEVLEIAAENNRDFQARREQLYRTALDLTFERWRFSNRPFASLDGDVSGTGDESASASVDGQAGFTRLLGSGASIVADIGSSLFRVVSTGDGWDAVGDIGLSITQPLLRGAGKRIVMEPLTQAERDVVYEVRAYERFRRTFAVDVARRVYNLLQDDDELVNEERNYENLVDLRERNEALAQAGRMSDVEAAQARQDELRSEARLIALRANLERARDDFNFFLGLPIGVDLQLDPGEFERLTEVDELLDGIEEKRAVEVALEERLDHQTSRDVLDDAARSVMIAEDALRAGLSLSASANSSTEEGRPASFSFDDTSWSLGLSLDLPVDRVAERNAYRRSLISYEATRRSVEEEADGIEADVRDSLRNTENARKDYEIQKGAVMLAERRVEGALLSLDAGRASTRDVLEAREALVEAQNGATAALINFTLARLDLYVQLEALRVEPDGIRVDDEVATRLTEAAR